MDITFPETEYMHTNEGEDQKHLISDFQYEVPIHNIKTENNVIKHNLFDADDAASDRKVVTSTRCEDVAIQHVKTEPDDEGGQVSPDTENSTNYDMVFKSEPKDDLHSIKTENNEAIDQDIVESQHIVNNDTIHISVLPEVFLLKNKQYCVMQQNGSDRDQINTDVEHRDVFVGEGDSPKNTLLLEEATRKAELSTAGAQHVTTTAPASDERKTRSDVKEHACVICNKRFRNKYKLNEHMKAHSDVKPYSCDICNKSFKQKSALTKHSTTIHSGVKKYTCDVCCRVLSSKFTFICHMKLHSGDKPYSCDVCSKVFTTKYNLAAHVRTHADDKPYSCDVCGKSFSTKHKLVAHLWTHSGDKPYSCDICKKSFLQKSTLNAHLNIHCVDGPYSCDVCNKSFLQKHSLTRHVVSHSDVRPYSCDICSSSYKRKSYLNSHLRTHSGVKPYSCDVCSKAFTTKCYLAVHLRTHSVIKPYSCHVCNRPFAQKSHLAAHLRTKCKDKL